MLLPFLFAVVVGIVTELSRQGVLCELLYVDDVVMIVKRFMY